MVTDKKKIEHKFNTYYLNQYILNAKLKKKKNNSFLRNTKSETREKNI